MSITIGDATFIIINSSYTQKRKRRYNPDNFGFSPTRTKYPGPNC